MNTRVATVALSSVLFFLFIFGFGAGCSNSHINRNRDAVWPIRVRREAPEKTKITVKTKSDATDNCKIHFKNGTYSLGDENGDYFLGLKLHSGKTTGMITSSASGVVLTRDGYILTNHHVTRSSPKQIEVVFKQGSDEVARSAKLIAWSEFGPDGNDLAVIKVDATFDNVARFGESRQIYESAHVYNWGYPFGLSKNSHGKNYFDGKIGISRVKIPFFGKQRRFLMGIKGAGGVSGSGIFAEDGRLIGVMQGHTGWRLWMVGIPVDQIREFLTAWRIPFSG